MAFISQLTGISENTSGYSVKVYESSLSSYSTNSLSSSTYFTDIYGNSSSGSYSAVGLDSYTETSSDCYTRTYYSSSAYNSASYTASAADNAGYTNAYSSSYIQSTSSYQKAEKSYGQYGYTLKNDYSYAYEYVEPEPSSYSESGVTSQIISYFTSTNTNSDTIWSYRESRTELIENPNGVTSFTSTYNTYPDGTTSFLYSSATTTHTINCKVSYSSQETWQAIPVILSKSSTYKALYNTFSIKTVSGIKTFYTTDLTLVGSGPKSYSYMIICSYDNTGNIIFTARTESGDSIRDSDRNFLLGANDTASFSKSDVILSSFNSGQIAGSSTSYILTINDTFTVPATITKTSVDTNLVRVVGDTGIVQYSTSSYTEDGYSYETFSASQGFTYYNTAFFYSDTTQGSHLSISCRQMIYTTSTHKKFLFYDTITQSFNLTSYIFTTSSYTRYLNYYNITSTSVFLSGSNSGSNSTYQAGTEATYSSTFRSASSSNQQYGISSNAIAQYVQTSLHALATKFTGAGNIEYISTYYTEVLNAGIFINKERKGFFGYSPSSASIAAFYHIVHPEVTIPPFSPLKPKINLVPFAGSFLSSTSSVNQAYSESPSSTAFSQTISYSSSYGSETTISTSTRTIGYSLSGYSTFATSEETTMVVDDEMYYWFYKNYPYGSGVPQIYPIASNMLNSFGYFASNGSYYLNDYIFVNTTGPYPVVQYIDGSQTFAYPISKNSAADGGNGQLYYLDNGRYTADSIVSGAVVYGGYDQLFLGIIGGEFSLAFSVNYPNP